MLPVLLGECCIEGKRNIEEKFKKVGNDYSCSFAFMNILVLD
jgi:hypothetical protein